MAPHDVLLFLAALCAYCACAESGQTVVGRWLSLETSKGGIGAVFTFYADGTLEFSPAALGTSKYRMQGNRLIETSGTAEGEEEAETIELLSAQSLQLRMSERAGWEMIRIGTAKNPKDPLIGMWRPKKASEADSLQWRFQENGTVLTSTNGQTELAPYTREGSRILVQFDGAPRDAILRWDGDKPVLHVRPPLMDMKREGTPEDPKNLLLGTWLWVVPGRAPPERRTVTIHQFRRDGTVRFTAAFRSDRGKYAIKGDQIRVQIEEGAAVEGTFRWEGDILVLPGPRGTGTSRFERY